MKGVLLIIVILLFVFAYFYYGYYQDYKRNPKEFLRSVIGMPIGFIVNVFGLSGLNKKIKDWVNDK